MTSEQITSAWSASSNGLTSSETKSLTAAFLNEIKARRRRSSWGLAAVAAAFAVITGLSITLIVSQADLPPKHVWTIASMNALVWGGWIYALLTHVSCDRPPTSAGAPVRAALRRALDQRRSHLGHLRIIAGGLLLSLPLAALSIQNLLEAGKIAPEDLPFRIIFALGAYGVAFACLGSDYFGRSTREVEDLKTLLADCDRDA